MSGPYEDACTCDTKDTGATKSRPDTTGNPLSMEDRFGRGYSINQIGMVVTQSRVNQEDYKAFARSKAGMKGREGLKGMEAYKPKEISRKNKCQCGRPGANG